MTSPHTHVSICVCRHEWASIRTGLLYRNSLSLRLEPQELAEATAEVGDYFPPRFWGLDPLFSAKVKLNIRDVLILAHYPEYPGQCD